MALMSVVLSIGGVWEIPGGGIGVPAQACVVVVAFILSMRTLLARRGSPGVTRNFGAQPTLGMPITPVLLLDDKLSKAIDPVGAAPLWQLVQLLLNIIWMLPAAVCAVLATPNTAEATVEPPANLIANVT